ncbi:unnamed protein product [Adineta steineri]|uniref:Probable glycerol kinase n=1 Tax=Adineta steineri TaxID=433720 RepID=A0A813Q8N0_9BILA|nr:unnamed protein product [Adineta steineri]
MPNKKTKQQTNEFVGAIDQGTSSSRFLIFNASNLELVTYHQETIEISTPQPGWVEQDPNELLEKTTLCIEKAVEKFEGLGHNKSDIKVIGITNQRETTILWDKETGKVLHNALVWLDARTQETVDFLLKQYNKRQDCLQEKCGLPLSTYFSALKIRWLMDNCDEVRTAIEEKRCCFGTVDSWLLYNLLSDDKNTVHVTDVTNASRTMLMNIRTLKWDASLCDFFSIPEHILPEIKSSSTIFGYINKGALQGVPVGAVLGDQQAALVGQRCWTKGTAKSTYGTGCFILYNTGNDLAYSLNGLLTTVAYKWNDDDPVYALEGSIAIAGQCIKWLRDNLGLIPDSKSTETIAASVKDTGGVYFVPAFSGLFAPYWRSDARETSLYIFYRLQQNHWLDPQNYLKYNPRRKNTWQEFLLIPVNKTLISTDISKNLNEHKTILPDFFNTLYGEHEISFERSFEALQWHKNIYDNKTKSVL